MKFITYWLLISSFVGQLDILHAQANSSQRTDTRLYLFDGSVVEGTLIEKSSDFFIIQAAWNNFLIQREIIRQI